MNDDGPESEYQRVPPTSRAAVVVFWVAVAAAVGFFLVVPAVLAMFAAAFVRDRISPLRDERGHRLATAAVRVSGWAAGLGVMVFVLLEMPMNHPRELSNRSGVCGESAGDHAVDGGVCGG